MCNLYLMYYSSDEDAGMKLCFDEEEPKLSEVWVFKNTSIYLLF